ncbi:2,3-dihydro-2,3-dihydroxybenzoate dehydrogenase [Paenibacillus solanacearum]|uniref:2,3-dihydro-2,3-dihydroxybenzoate dehydrogenase n=1 Tax=Paenibacillus solanacearum TaxID=2048548 RepID=A0A916JQL3_9BACL|nr:2,3-dihydro-2,3-dihydroxybenzoate dehydrogenase [Paenibacillus solanacearum]CAG7594799.1 2,3-dihydro-2,3-dihydroxybenzoate dehydrogenase [Paenibacillus solanacearum]
MEKEFQGKIALVTGAAQGIGEAIVRALCERGATVAVLDRQKEPLERLSALLTERGSRVRAFPLNLKDHEAIPQMVTRIEEELGPIDILVHAAGVLRTGPLATYADEDWNELLAVNVGSLFHLSRAVSARMIPRRRGVIVTVSSNAAAVPRMGMGAYATTKAAATMLTKCFALELAEHGIRCNIVSPGSTDTPMLRSMWLDEQERGAQQTIDGSLPAYRTGIPLRKLATPEDIADGVLYLASERASHLTMHDLRIDGGATLGV